jgi:hypothetical protein
MVEVDRRTWNSFLLAIVLTSSILMFIGVVTSFVAYGVGLKKIALPIFFAGLSWGLPCFLSMYFFHKNLRGDE